MSRYTRRPPAGGLGAPPGDSPPSGLRAAFEAAARAAARQAGARKIVPDDSASLRLTRSQWGARQRAEWQRAEQRGHLAGLCLDLADAAARFDVAGAAWALGVPIDAPQRRFFGGVLDEAGVPPSVRAQAAEAMSALRTLDYYADTCAREGPPDADRRARIGEARETALVGLTSVGTACMCLNEAAGLPASGPATPEPPATSADRRSRPTARGRASA